MSVLRDEETGLSLKELLVLHMDLAGIYKDAAIATASGYAVGSLNGVRKKPLYQAAFKKMLEQVKARQQEVVLGIGERFDALLPEALTTFQELNKSADSDSVRIRAAENICDRAPNGPRKTLTNDKAPQRALFLQLGEGKLKEIRSALLDAGNKDVLDLLEFVDYQTVGREGAEGERESALADLPAALPVDDLGALLDGVKASLEALGR